MLYHILRDLTCLLNQTELYINFNFKGGDYKHGDLRLVGGSYIWQGRVEIFLSGEWGTISYGATDAVDAYVVCRQLGYDTRCEFNQ